MNRALKLQVKLLRKISQYEKITIERDYPLDWERIHLASCARIGQLLALKRQADPELAAIACAIHDYGRLVTGRQENHAQAGYEPVKEFLAECGMFSAEEQESLALAAKHHSSKQVVGTVLEEIVKDADVLDCYQHGQELARPEQRQRLAAVLAELNLSAGR